MSDNHDNDLKFWFSEKIKLCSGRRCVQVLGQSSRRLLNHSVWHKRFPLPASHDIFTTCPSLIFPLIALIWPMLPRSNNGTHRPAVRQQVWAMAGQHPRQLRRRRHHFGQNRNHSFIFFSHTINHPKAKFLIYSNSLLQTPFTCYIIIMKLTFKRNKSNYVFPNRLYRKRWKIPILRDSDLIKFVTHYSLSQMSWLRFLP